LFVWRKIGEIWSEWQDLNRNFLVPIMMSAVSTTS